MFRRPRHMQDGLCSLCGQISTNIRSHLARHLKQLALFAIPQTDYIEDSDSGSACSDVAHGSRQDSNATPNSIGSASSNFPKEDASSVDYPRQTDERGEQDIDAFDETTDPPTAEASGKEDNLSRSLAAVMSSKGITPSLLGLQKRTFLPYLRGVVPEDLRLGSLYLNPLEPTDGLSSLRWKFMGDEDDQDIYGKAISKWTRQPELDRPFVVEIEASKARSLGFNFAKFLGLKGRKSEESLVRIQGQSGRRVKIRNPEAFLEEVIKQEGAQEWIREHATTEHKSIYGRRVWKLSKMWMVTAVQYVTGGQVQTTGSELAKVDGETDATVRPAVNAPPGAFKSTATVNHDLPPGSINEFEHEEELVWAAQFMPVAIRFRHEEVRGRSDKEHEVLPKTIASFRFEEIPDLGAKGIR